MKSIRVGSIALIATALLAAGCGQSETEKAQRDLEHSMTMLAIARSRSAISGAIVGETDGDPVSLTVDFVNLVRGDVEDGSLSEDEATTILRDEANELTGGSCSLCVTGLDRELGS